MTAASNDDPARIVNAATAEIVGLLARKIAFSPNPKLEIAPCQAAVIQALGQHLPALTPRERDWMVHYIMRRVLTIALEVLSLEAAPIDD
jgi:hypothetical protein